MTFVAPESAPVNAARIPSIVVLGADALLAALPATPVQLAHACVLAGYQSVIPASWGDELIAAASLRALSQHGHAPAIQCSCPHVAHRLLAVGTDLRPFLLSLVAPPVVLARYLRAAHGAGKLRITYVGRCPGAADESIDARLTPEELLAILTDRQIVLDEQPRVYDSVIPPDRRRYRSQPGGVPTPEMLFSATSGNPHGARALVELYGDDLPVELAQHLLAGKPVLIDCAPKLGCVCGGATPDIDAAEARSRVVALEPPRASTPIVDEQLIIEASLPLPASPRSAIDIVVPPGGAVSTGRPTHAAALERAVSPRHEEGGAQSPPIAAPEPAHGVLGSTPSRRQSPSRGVARPATGALPIARDAGGRQLPRTYVAHRRTPMRTPRSMPVVDAESRPPTSPGHSGEAPATPNGGGSVAYTPTDAAAPVVATTSPVPTPADSGVTPPTYVSIASSPQVESPSGTRPALPSPPDDRATRTESPRYAERPVALPVTPRSDGTPRQEPAPSIAGERPLMQLLTLGLLIAMIVLVSAAVGVLVGRWMTQR